MNSEIMYVEIMNVSFLSSPSHTGFLSPCFSLFVQADNTFVFLLLLRSTVHIPTAAPPSVFSPALVKLPLTAAPVSNAEMLHKNKQHKSETLISCWVRLTLQITRVINANAGCTWNVKKILRSTSSENNSFLINLQIYLSDFCPWWLHHRRTATEWSIVLECVGCGAASPWERSLVICLYEYWLLVLLRRNEWKFHYHCSNNSNVV